MKEKMYSCVFFVLCVLHSLRYHWKERLYNLHCPPEGGQALWLHMYLIYPNLWNNRIKHHGYYPAWLLFIGGWKVKAKEPSTACDRPWTMPPITWRQVGHQQLIHAVLLFECRIVLDNGKPQQSSVFFFHVNQDVPLISLANIFQNARLWEDALTVARMAVEIAPHFVVNHFTLANVYITMVICRNACFCLILPKHSHCVSLYILLWMIVYVPINWFAP